MWSEADITNAVLASVGLVVALLGLGAVFCQIRKLTGAAEAASEAALEARTEMVQQVIAAGLGSTRMALRALRGELRAGDVQSALISSDLLRESLVALRSRSSGRLPQERQDEIEGAVGTVREIQKGLEEARAATDSPPDIAEFNSRISELIDFVVDWQEGPLSFERETTDHDQRDT